MRYLDDVVIERRKGPDLLIKLMKVINELGWLLYVVSLFLLELRKDLAQNYLDLQLTGKMPPPWKREDIKYVFYILVLNFILSLTGIFLNGLRHHRKKDQYRISLIIMGIIALLGILYYLFYF